MAKEKDDIEYRAAGGMKMSPEKAREIVERYGVEDTGEEFLIKTHFKDGKEVTHHILKRNNVPIARKGGMIVELPVEDVIEAVKTLYPTVEKGADIDIEKAVEAVKDRRKEEESHTHD